MNKAYDKVTWQNTPNTATPLNASNLNKMSDALDTIDDRVITLDEQASSASSAITALQEGKVDKVAGKGLSTNDYTDADKTKLAGISAEANRVEITPVVTEGTTLATISIDGVDTAIKGSDIDVDSTPSSTSTNPLENKAVYELVQSILPEKTATGNPISIDDASGLDAKSALVTFAPKQSGTGDPSPSNIRPISGWNGLNLFNSGKNMFDKTDIMSGYKLTSSGGTTSGSSFFVSDYIHLPEGDYIAEKIVGTNNGYGLFTYDENKTKVRDLTPSGSTADKSFTIQSGEKYIRLSALLSRIDEVQLELGSTATTYEPYNGETHTATFPDTVYGGSYDFVNGKLVVDKAIVDLGTLTWTYYTGGYNPIFYATKTGAKIYETGDTINALCSCYKKYGTAQQRTIAAQVLSDYEFLYLSGSTNFCCRNSQYTDKDTFKTAMGGQYVCYELATPIEITLTPEEIELLKGSNTVWTDGDTVQIKYSADIAAYIAEQLTQSNS